MNNQRYHAIFCSKVYLKAWIVLFVTGRTTQFMNICVVKHSLILIAQIVNRMFRSSECHQYVPTNEKKQRQQSFIARFFLSKRAFICLYKFVVQVGSYPFFIVQLGFRVLLVLQYAMCVLCCILFW